MADETIEELRMLNRKLGALQEREMLTGILKEIALSDKYGEYAYLADLQKYLLERDES